MVMTPRKKIKKGDLIKSSKSGNVGIVRGILGDPKDPHALYVTVEGKTIKWVLKREEQAADSTAPNGS